MSEELKKVKIKWPETPSEMFSHYRALRLLANDPVAKEKFIWDNSGAGGYFPEYVLLTEDVAMLYILST